MTRFDILNKAAYRYLVNMGMGLDTLIPKAQDLEALSNKERQIYQKLISLVQELSQIAEYQDTVSYKQIYTRLHELAEKLPKTADQIENQALKQFHAELFIRMFENDNKIHNEIYSEVIRGNTQRPEHDQAKPYVENTQKGRVQKLKARLNKKTYLEEQGIANPEHGANKFFSGLWGINYHPLKRNNVPYISFVRGGAKNLRIGAQVNGLMHVNQNFRQYMAAKQMRAQAKAAEEGKQFNSTTYHHVYINLQKRDMSEGGRFERFFERQRSRTLEKLEAEGHGVAVITLPADSRSFFKHFSHHSGRAKKDEKIKLQDMMDGLIDAIEHNKSDFYMSEQVKMQVLGLTPEMRALVIESLFKDSARDILKQDPLDMNVEMDPAKAQAVMFNFVKFHLTKHTLDSLSPSTYNISCKDNIDRGGAHNLWYEFCLMLSDPNSPGMTKEDFEKHLDASAMLVKHRPMNDHRNALWNAVYQRFCEDPGPMMEKMPWIQGWLKENIPVREKVSYGFMGAQSFQVGNFLRGQITAESLSNKQNEIVAEEMAFVQSVSNQIALAAAKISQPAPKVELDKPVEDAQRKDSPDKGIPEPEVPEVVTETQDIPNMMQADELKRAFQTACLRRCEIETKSMEPLARVFVVKPLSHQQQVEVAPITVEQKQPSADRNPQTRVSFSKKDLSDDSILASIQALVKMQAELQKDSQKTLRITAKGDPNIALAFLLELNKYGMKGSLRSDEFSSEQQAEIQSLLEQRLQAEKPKRRRSMTIGHDERRAQAERRLSLSGREQAPLAQVEMDADKRKPDKPSTKK